MSYQFSGTIQKKFRKPEINRNCRYCGVSCSRNFWTRRQSGASIVEFFVVAPVLLFLGLGTVQVGLLYHAKTTLNYATFEAARVGAVSHAQVDPMMGELAYRLAPVYGGKGTEQSAGTAMARAMADTVNPAFGKITVLNPTVEMFDAWEMPDSVTGALQIPNHHIRHQNSEIVRAGVNIQDANLLKIRAEYGYKLGVPFVGPLVTQALLTMNPSQAAYYHAGRIPLVSVATVRMQNEARRNPVAVVEAVSPGGNTGEFGGSQPIPQATQLDPDQTAQVANCDEFGLGEPSTNVQSLLDGNSDAAGEQEGPQQCEVGDGVLASVFDDLQGQNPLVSGLQPCS